MAQDDPIRPTGRERQILDVLYRREWATVANVREGMDDPPSYSAVRTMLARLEEKGLVTHERDGKRYVYRTSVPVERARDRALDRLVRTFFDGSALRTVASFLKSERLSGEELEELQRRIERAREERA